MSKESIFTAADRPGTSTLPPELQGKTPEEIAAYYQQREQILLRRTQPSPAAAPKEEPVDDKIDLFGDPTGSINRVVQRQVAEQIGRVTSAATPAIVNACRISLKDAYPDYGRFSGEIERRMAMMTPEAQMNPEYWNMQYKLVKGEKADELAAEAAAKAIADKNPVERPSAKGTDPPKPRELSEEEIVIAGKLGVTKDQYRTAGDRYDREEGRLPLTTDSKHPHKRKGAA